MNTKVDQVIRALKECGSTVLIHTSPGGYKAQYNRFLSYVQGHFYLNWEKVAYGEVKAKARYKASEETIRSLIEKKYEKQTEAA